MAVLRLLTPLRPSGLHSWGKILFGANSCERQSTVRRVKEIWKKGGFQY